ncbi:unnamed protein product [Dibothriocephalus latus]|uniref:Uncharacterized protein n=1 Tax=Dibothriocephalus latus TaxID=60516 RepID=A0A3P7NAK8_DIBLA|nr:unnamed protein product [Dibothriocephalus latus]
MTAEECRAFKAVVKEQLQQEGIQTYDFPLSALNAEKARSADDHNTSLSEIKTLRLRQPFAVCTGTQEIQKEDGTKATTVFVANVDIQESQLVVFFFLHRKLNVWKDGF